MKKNPVSFLSFPVLQLFISMLLPDHTNWLSVVEQLVEPDAVYTRPSWVSVSILLTWITYKVSALCRLGSILLV